MTKKEFAIIASAIRTYYPKENILPNKQAVEIWHKQLEDIPYDLASNILSKWVANNKWSPTIADIREQAAKAIYGDVKSWGEAWEEVIYAVRHYGSYQVQEALDSFDNLTRDIISQLGGFLKICQSERIEVERANFRDLYEKQIEKEKERMTLSPDLLKRLETLRTDTKELIEEKERIDDGRYIGEEHAIYPQE